jgi:hypothetical protein
MCQVQTAHDATRPPSHRVPDLCDHPQSSAPGLLLQPRSSSLHVMPHLPPAHHETSKHDSSSERKIKEKQNKTIPDSNSNLAKSMTHQNQIKKLTTWFLNGDSTNISQFAKNLIANMRDEAPPLSMVEFVWEEIKGTSLNPQKNCGFAPYFMFIIEDVTSRSFPKEGIHMPFWPNPTKKPLIPPAQASSPP